jgi:arylsulfatase A-like enzyme
VRTKVSHNIYIARAKKIIMNKKNINLIFIVVDTFRADNLSCYGSREVKTPNLDRFAQESVVFENCYAEGLPTIPVRRTLFTGKRTFPWVDWKISRDVRLVVPG